MKLELGIAPRAKITRPFAARYFLGFTAAGVSVGRVAWRHDRGGFTLLMQAFGSLSVLVTLGALIFPDEKRVLTMGQLWGTP